MQVSAISKDLTLKKQNSQNQKPSLFTFVSHLSFDMEYKLNQCTAKSMSLFPLLISEELFYKSQCILV